MLISLATLLATLSSICRSRAALGLENLALRHQIGVLQRSARKRPKLTSGDRLLWIFLSRLWRDWCSALAIRQARNGYCLASCRLSAVLDLEGAARPTRTTRHFARGPRSSSPSREDQICYPGCRDVVWSKRICCSAILVQSRTIPRIISCSG